MNNKTFMQSSGINIFIGAYQQSIATLILLLILLVFNIIWMVFNIIQVEQKILNIKTGVGIDLCNKK